MSGIFEVVSKENCTNPTDFLDNIILTESCLFENIFDRKYNSKRLSILMKVLIINASREIIQPSSKNKNNHHKWYLNEGLGYWIYEARRRNISDEEIYKRIIESRDTFLRTKNISELNYDFILLKKQCLEVYDSARKGLISMLS